MFNVHSLFPQQQQHQIQQCFLVCHALTQFGCLKLYSIIALALFFLITMNWWLLCVGVWKCHNFLYHIARAPNERRGKIEQLILFRTFCISIKFIKIELNLSGMCSLWVRINFVNFLEVMIHIRHSRISIAMEWVANVDSIVIFK